MITVIVVLVLVAAAAVGYWIWLSRNYALPCRADEIHTVKTDDLWQIQLYRYLPKKGEGEPVFLCHSAVANHLNFDVPEGESLVDVLTGKGFECWAIELRGTKSSIPPYGRRRSDATMDDYLLQDLPAALEYIRHETRYSNLHWVGHSMGGMLLYAYALIHGAREIAGAATIGAPPGFDGVRFRSPRLLLMAHRLCWPVFNYVVRGLSPILTWLRPKFGFVPVNWANVSPEIGTRVFFNLLEMPPPKVAETLARWASTNDWRVQNDAIDVIAGLKRLDAPLLAIFGAGDPLTPVAKAEAFVKALPGRDKKCLVLSEKHGNAADYNHVDLVFGRESAKEVFTPIAEWLAKHPCVRHVAAADLTGQAESSMRATAAAAKSGSAEKRAPKKKRAQRKPSAKKGATEDKDSR